MAVSLPVLGETPQTLVQVMAAALVANFGLKAEQAQKLATDQGVGEALADGLPTLSGSLVAGRTDQRFRPGDGTDTFRPRGMALTATMPVFGGFRTLHGVREARALAQAGSQRLRGAEQDLAVRAATVFADVRRDRAIVRLRRMEADFLSRQITAIERRGQAGDLSRTDGALARSRLEGARAALLSAEADLAASEADFTSVVGSAPGPLAEPVLPEHLLPDSLEEAQVLAEAENPLIGQVLAEADAADERAGAAAGAFWPQVDIEASYRSDYDTISGYDREEETKVLARLTIPFYEGGRRRARLARANAESVARRYAAAQRRTDVAAAVETLWRQRQAAARRVATEGRRSAAARLAVTGASREAEIGARSVLDLLDAERDRIDAGIALARAMSDRVVTTFELLSATGRLSPDGSPGRAAN